MGMDSERAARLERMARGLVDPVELSPAEIEIAAKVAYAQAWLPLHRTPVLPGPGKLLFRLVGDASLVEVDVGVAPGAALLERATWDSTVPPLVKVLARQAREDLTMACAHAVAQFMAMCAWQAWSDATEHAVALAVVMPEAHFRAAAEREPASVLAARFVVRPAAVAERLRMLSLDASGSGQRPALRLASGGKRG